MGEGKLGFQLSFAIQHNQTRRAGRTLPKEIPWYSVLLEAGWNPGMLNAGRRNISHENFVEEVKKYWIFILMRLFHRVPQDLVMEAIVMSCQCA